MNTKPTFGRSQNSISQAPSNVINIRAREIDSHMQVPNKKKNQYLNNYSNLCLDAVWGLSDATDSRTKWSTIMCWKMWLFTTTTSNKAKMLKYTHTHRSERPRGTTSRMQLAASDVFFNYEKSIIFKRTQLFIFSNRPWFPPAVSVARTLKNEKPIARKPCTKEMHICRRL